MIDRLMAGGKGSFRVSRASFEYICRLVGPALSRQDTAMRAAVPVEKRVSTRLRRLATGDCYRTCDRVYLAVSTGYSGSLHDARVLSFDAAENENILMKQPTMDLNGTVIRPLIVGDSEYPLKTWLLRPVKDNGTLT